MELRKLVCSDAGEAKDLFETNPQFLALMNALPVGVCFSLDATCERIIGNAAFVAQFGGQAGENLSASAPEPTLRGRKVRYYREGKMLKSSELPMQIAAQENREVPPTELEVHMPDGRRWLAEVSAAPIRDSSGRVSAVIGLSSDITERKKKEAQLRENENRFRALAEASSEGVVVSEKGIVIYTNRQFAQIMGYEDSELIGMHVSKLLAPEERGEKLLKIILKGRTHRGEHWHLRKDGSRILLETHGRPLIWNGRMARITALLDITERKRTEFERNSTMEFLSMVNRSKTFKDLLQQACCFFQKNSGCDAAAIRVRDGEDYPWAESRGIAQEILEMDRSLSCRDPKGCVVLGPDGKPELACLCGRVLLGKCEWANLRGTFWCSDLFEFMKSASGPDQDSLRGYCTKSGFSSVALIPFGKPNDPCGLIQLKSRNKGHFTPESIACWERIADKFFIAVEKFQALEALELSKNELEKRVRHRTAELEIKNAALAAEISEHEKTEAALRESEARFRLLAENSTDMIGRFTPQGICQYVSPACQGLLGFQPEELIGSLVSDFCHPEDRLELIHYHSVLLEGVKPITFTCRVRRKNGTYIWLETSCRSARDSQSKSVLEIQSSSRDITARKAVEEALKQSEASLRTLSNNLPEGAIFQFVRKVDGRMLFSFLSDGAKQLLGVPAQEVIKDPTRLENLVHSEDREALCQARQKAIRELSGFDHEARILTPCGEIKWMHWRAAPRKVNNGDLIWDGVMTNVTRHRKNEEALQRANRALRVLKECDEALVRAHGEQELLERVCGILVEIGGAKMAWVGFAEADRKKAVRPVASAGDTGPNGGYLKSACITWADTPRGRGPTGRAIRSKEVVVCHEVADDGQLKPWREQQMEQKLVASIALPLIVEDTCLGSLTIYSSEADAFNFEEVELLKQLAGDLSFGIAALRTRAKRQALEEELLRISEREKQLIAQELHDGLCQHLTGTAFLGSVLHRKLAARNAPEAEAAKQICDQLSIGASDARNLSHGLHPVRPEPEGLMDALATLARTVSRLFQLQCSFRCADPVLVANPTVANHLFRIAQEAINNAIKHGRASEVIMRLKKFRGGISLSIRDNGLGIGTSTAHSSGKGMGLQIMSHRAAAIGASLKVQSAGKRGTLVSCALANRERMRL